ncbi:hypothetical protein BKA66DRAFT_591628 [Pyrenochaeta sp. MPI-SDFR-AT-0127]|nr:hypothetical protein BKA66DRAFT_591628 [Pyrenochaeta sp. MPI-SDFR-AT-0127]
MRISSAVLLVALPALVVADLHRTFVCVVRASRNVVRYHEAATTAACNAYRNRNTGNSQWDKCPDCVLRDDQGTVKFCASDRWHLGGDEVYHYCRKFGGTDSIAWN